MRAGSVRATLVPASSPVSTVPTATGIALTLIGVGIVTALTVRRTAIPLTPARSPRTGSVPGSYRWPNSTESFRPKLARGRQRCNRQRHAVEPHSNRLGPVWVQRLIFAPSFSAVHAIKRLRSFKKEEKRPRWGVRTSNPGKSRLPVLGGFDSHSLPP
jgi:hypothetical protein